MTSVLLVSSLPLVAAIDEETPGQGGTLVRATEGDVAMPYSEITGFSICFLDMDGSGHVNQEDSVILTFRHSCSGNSDRNDIRLAVWEGNPAGERIGSGTERGISLKTINPEPRFYFLSQENTNRLNTNDTVYLRLESSDQTAVRMGDIRITASNDKNPGSWVESTDADQGQGVQLLGTVSERLRHVDVLDTDSFTHHDAVYLTADTERTVAGQGDVRIYGPEEGLEFGRFLGPGEPEPQDSIRTIHRYLCTVDQNDSGIYSAGDPLYLSVGSLCSGDIQSGDLRLSNSTYGLAGSRVDTGDADHGGRYGILPDARVAYIDKNNDNRLSRGDIAVLRITSPDENELRAGDVLLTPTNRGAGVILLEEDPLIATSTRDLGRFEDMVVFKPSSGATSITIHDPVYLSPETNTGQGLNPEDIRLSPAGTHPFGGPVGLETGELRSSLTRDAGSICTNTPIGDEYRAGDPVYLRLDGTCPNIVATGMVRLVPVDDYPAFSTVRSSDDDRGRPLFTPEDTPRLRYLSIGESGWGYSTRLYLNIVSPNNNGVEIGDIRLTPAGDGLLAGRAVVAGDSDRNIPEFALLGDLRDHTGYIDITDSGSFSTRDHAYIVVNQDQEHVSPLSVRLTPLPSAFTPPHVEEPAGTSTPPPDSPEPGDSDDGEDDTMGEDEDDEEELKTPGPAIGMILLAILATLVCPRRSIKC